MGSKARRKKKRRGRHKHPAPRPRGGALQGMRNMFRSAAGVSDHPKKKSSLLDTIITLLLIAGAIGFLVYRYMR